jgi:hypothetical protein
LRRALLITTVLIACPTVPSCRQQQEQGQKQATASPADEPYTPTRIEWLVVYLNSTARFEQFQNLPQRITVEYSPTLQGSIVANLYYDAEPGRESITKNTLAYVTQRVQTRVRNAARARGWDWLHVLVVPTERSGRGQTSEADHGDES